MNKDDYKNVYGLELAVLNKLEELKIEGKDDIFLTCKAPAEIHDNLTGWVESIKKTIRSKYGVENVLIVMLDDSVSLESLDEEKMAEYGWYKGGNKKEENAPKFI